VLVSDLRGVLPLFQHHLPSIVDARQRLLTPGGVLIPGRDALRVAVACAPDLYEARVTPWDRNEYGLDMRAVSRLERNTWQRCHARADQVLLEAQTLATVDYATVDGPDVRGELRWTAERAGDAHGLLVWFDADLDAETGLTNAPGAPPVIYGQAFFPWSRPISLALEDTVSVAMAAVLVGEDYVWTWQTRVVDAEGHAVKAEFRQSTFFGAPLSQATLAKRSAHHVPALNEEGRLDRLVLELLAERMPLGRIADEVFAKFPGRLPTRHQALSRVADLSTRYSD
jgi:protein arginine N-methyltransferase 1